MRRLGWIFGLVVLGLGVYLGLAHPKTPLPTAWNPIAPFRIQDQQTPVTTWKMSRIGNATPLCEATLAPQARFDRLPDFAQSDVCHIRNRLRVSELAGVSVRPLETRCETALVAAGWIIHGVQPAAQAAFGQSVTEIRTQGSYNCRQIGGSNRMSTHATASAIDIAGFTLADGTRVELSENWADDGPAGDFLRDVRDASCDWFSTTLGPDYNQAHADHFHLQVDGWGTCR